MDRYLARRWKAAKGYTTEQVVVVSATRGLYRVASSGGGWYRTQAILHKGILAFARCTCKDFGECKLHGIPVCKHVLAAGIAATQEATHEAA